MLIISFVSGTELLTSECDLRHTAAKLHCAGVDSEEHKCFEQNHNEDVWKSK